MQYSQSPKTLFPLRSDFQFCDDIYTNNTENLTAVDASWSRYVQLGSSKKFQKNSRLQIGISCLPIEPLNAQLAARCSHSAAAQSRLSLWVSHSSFATCACTHAQTHTHCKATYCQSEHVCSKENTHTCGAWLMFQRHFRDSQCAHNMCFSRSIRAQRSCYCVFLMFFELWPHDCLPTRLPSVCHAHTSKKTTQ